MPMPKLIGQVPPGRAGARYPQHGLDKPTVILRRHAAIARLTGQKILDAFPFCITQDRSDHNEISMKTIFYNDFRLFVKVIENRPEWHLLNR